MGHVRVIAGTLAEGRIQSLSIELVGLGKRTLDRGTTIAWMKDGHSFIPVADGVQGAALQLVPIEDGDTVEYVVRTDNQPTSEDSLPPSLTA